MRPSSRPSSGNLLDFTNGKAPSPSPAANNYLAATIQPQRRGRPTRGHGPSALGPPSDIKSSPSMTFSPSSAGNSPAQPSSSPSGLPSTSRPQSISPQPQLVNDIKRFAVDFSDAFEPQGGTSETRGESSSFGGFENSFAPDTSAAASTQKMSPLPTSKSLQPGVGNGVSTSSSGFESSFSPMQDSTLSSSKTANIPTIKAKYPTPSSSATIAPEGDTSFEDRYPTLERLHSDQSVNEETQRSPLLSPHGYSVNHVSNDQARSSRGGSLQRSMPSYHQPSLTGGPLGEGHLSSGDINGGVPLPRSNQVTGTAFKSLESPSATLLETKQEPFLKRMDSSLSTSPTETNLPDYVDLPSPSVEASQPTSIPEPVEQLPPAAESIKKETERDNAEPAPPRDLLTGDDGSSLPFLSMQPSIQPLQTTSGHKAPPPLVSKPASLSLKSTSASPRPALAKAHSSIYDAKWSPIEAAKASLSAQAAPSGSSSSTSGVVESARQFVTSPLSENRSGFSGLQANQPIGMGSSQDIGRSKSLHGRHTMAPTPGPKSSTYPIPTVQHQAPIDGLVTGVASLNTASPTGSAPVHRADKPPLGKKPEIANKPDQLKVTSRNASPSTPPSETLLRNRSIYSNSSSAGHAPNSDFAKAFQPGSNAQAVEMKSDNIPAESSDTTADPPKRKVNALIAHWNQAGPPAQGTPASVLRAKPPIGSGRRL